MVNIAGELELKKKQKKTKLAIRKTNFESFNYIHIKMKIEKCKRKRGRLC